MDEFKAKRPVDVGIYLKEKGLSDDIAEIFEGEAFRIILISLFCDQAFLAFKF